MLQNVDTDRDNETYILGKALHFTLVALEEALKKATAGSAFQKELLNIADELDNLEPARHEPDYASLAKAIRRIVSVQEVIGCAGHG